MRGVRGGGSRYLYEPFDTANVRIDANEKVLEAKWEALEQRLKMIEQVLDRVERRIWLAVTGLTGFLMIDMVYGFLTQAH
ncbi:MAG: hypothetical protein AAFR93_03000 [Pseudomonadota bacterium]